MEIHTEKRSRRSATTLADSPLLCVLFYCGFALLVYAGGFAGHLALPAGGMAVVVDALRASPALVGQFAVFGLTLFVLNLLPLLLLLASTRVVLPRLQRWGISRLTYFLLALLFGWTAALAYNKLYFPGSSFALLLPAESAGTLASLGFVALAGFGALGVLPAAWRTGTMLVAILRRRAAQAVLGGALVVGVVPPMYSHWGPAPVPARQPDIIVIGLDSFSPLHMQHHPGKLPKLEGMLEQSIVFTQAVTPLARTFPAWTSILTAKYPVNSGARFNLTAFDQVDAAVTLPKLLRGRGYTTIYAQDERKFNNIDESFGFDATVGPKPGAAEFVLTLAADQPLVNFALLTPWAPQLFPFVALNRASPVHYEPDAFVDAIVDRLPADRSQPLFLAAHFCLAHHPYTWRTQGIRGTAGSRSVEGMHMAALGALDQQIERLVRALERAGRLDNAILVLVSDHGESLGYRDGRWVSMGDPAALRNEAFEVNGYTAFARDSGFSGHGSDVLDRTQYQTLLAFKGFGTQRERFVASRQGRLASLVDVMPTLAHALALPIPRDVDGVNLISHEAGPRVVPTETGLRLGALASIVDIDRNALLAESKSYYAVDPRSARLVVKPDRYPELVASKDIALHTDDWVLALLRKDTNPAFPRVALLVHKPTGAWTLGANRDLVAQAPLEALRRAAADFYGEEIADFHGTWAFR